MKKLYDFTHIWNRKQKSNKQTKKTNSQVQTMEWKGVGKRVNWVKGVKYMLRKELDF